MQLNDWSNHLDWNESSKYLELHAKEEDEDEEDLLSSTLLARWRINRAQSWINLNGKIADRSAVEPKTELAVNNNRWKTRIEIDVKDLSKKYSNTGVTTARRFQQQCTRNRPLSDESQNRLDWEETFTCQKLRAGGWQNSFHPLLPHRAEPCDTRIRIQRRKTRTDAAVATPPGLTHTAQSSPRASKSQLTTCHILWSWLKLLELYPSLKATVRVQRTYPLKRTIRIHPSPTKSNERRKRRQTREVLIVSPPVSSIYCKAILFLFLYLFPSLFLEGAGGGEGRRRRRRIAPPSCKMFLLCHRVQSITWF